MANKGQPVTYRPGVNRAITKKWAEAKAINYDDWDEDDGYDPDEPVQAAPAHARQQSWDTRSQGSQGYYASNRSVTGPPSPGRPSFDRGDERRHFSNIGGAQGPYPTAQRDPFEEIQHDQPYEPQMRGHRNQPSLQLRTGGGRPPMDQGQYYQGPYTATGPPRGDQFQDPRGAPFSAPIIGHSGRRSHSSGRPVPDEIYPRGEIPMRPGSQNSQGRSPTRAFPPRKSSLSQQQPPPEIQQYVGAGVAPVAQTPAPLTEGKALPFIRPADIYRRVEEEREKERRSQESSRPSFESAASRIRESSVASHRTGTDAPGDQRAPGDSADEADTTRRLQPTLPPVAERKSEYGFDNMIKNAEPNEPVGALDRTDTGLSKTSEPLSASSDYTNRADPTSASTLNSRQSPFDALTHGPNESSLPAPPEAPFLLPAVRGVSDFSNDMFGSHSSPSLLPASQPSSTMTGHWGENKAAMPVPGSNLQHQNSLGYRSMVNQAFDQSQDQVPPTPVSMSESVARSNSASASDISPIMSRNYEPPTSQPPIPEETNSRPGTSSTQGSLSRVATDKDLPAPPWFVPGYRRDSSPSTSENPDRRPLSLESSEMPKAEHGNLSAATSSTASWDKDSHGDDEDVEADQPAPQSAGALSHLEQPSLLTRTTSEDWREWETSRKQFKTQHGVQESVPSTGIPSPISRAESPAKGTVKDIAGKLENSGRNSPANLELTRPSNTRLESFRPSLPGGWQSYTTNTGAATPQPEDRLTEGETTQPHVDDDIPTAGPPRDYTDFNAPSKSAFAAAAAAGTALAGAFGVSHVLGSNDHDEQRETSVGNSRTSTLNFSYERETDEPPFGQDRQLESIPEGDHRSPTSPLPPTPLSKDTPTEAGAGQSTLDFFPAPLSLHQSRGSDQLTPQRPALAPSLSSEVNLQDDDNDRLRKEIVKSLTPKSSGFEDNSRLSPGQNDFPATSGSQRTVSTMGDSTLPKEYDSYWFESNNDTARNSAFEAATPNMPPVPETFEATTPKVPPVPETKGITSSADGDLPQKPLEQRFSWETAGEQTPPASVPPRIDALSEQGSPDTIRAPTSAPALPDPISSSEALRPAPSVNVAENKQLPLLVSMRGALLSEQAPIAPKSSFRERPMKEVLALDSPQERIQVFNAHRQHFAATEDGGLAQWLQSVGRAHPEHSTVMSANGVPTLQDDGTELHRPSPARLATKFRNISMPSSSYSGSGEPSGTKQAVEDGKRLLHVAGKFGKKGGTTAKGLLAKGKDKLRTVSSSAGDKGILQNRRRSGQIESSPTEAVRYSLAAAPPRSVAPHLDIPPVGNDDWSLPFGTPKDDTRKPAWESPSLAGSQREASIKRESSNTATTKYEASRPISESFATPASFIGQVIPRTDENSLALHESKALTVAPPTADHRTLETLEQSVEQAPSTVPESRVPLAIAAAVPLGVAGALEERKLQATNQGGLEKTDGLAVPQDRHSIISDVSSPSATHESRSTSPPRRSISNQNERVPAYAQNFPPTKTAEAEQERAHADAARADEEPLPIYEQPVVSRPDASSRLGENPQIVPVADLSSQRRQESKPVQPRPFSFAGPEALERMSTEAPAVTQPVVGEALNKQGTNVSVDEVQDDSDGAKARRSYSRPFGVDHEPNVHDHPAFRSPDAIDRTQMYSTESPLPSARREQASPMPRQNPITPKEGEEGYRIPGPYVQEYRSPTGRQNVVPFDTRQGPSQPVQAPRSPESARDRAGQGVTPQNMAALHGRDMGPPPRRPEQDRSKSRTFGGLFKREKSQAHEQNMLTPNKREKRDSIFRSKSRQDSISSQGSRLGSLRQTPSREQPYRQDSNAQVADRQRPSRDHLRSSTGSFDDEHAKKKRFSGIGGFFGKSSPSTRKGGTMNTHHDNAPMRQTAYQDTRQQQNQNIPQQHQVQRASTTGPGDSIGGRPLTEPRYQQQTTVPSPGYHNPNFNTSNNSQARGPPLNGYYGTSNQQYPVSAFPHGPDSVMPGRGDPGWNMQGPSQDRGFVQNPTGAFSAHPAQDVQSFDQRPSDLRVNTDPGSNVPLVPASTATPPMRTQSPNPSHSHNLVTTRAPNSASAATPATNRAVDLHKRSRSPKLGRQASSEDLTQSHPAANLGTFSAKSRSPPTAEGEEAGQEKPWAISLPTDEAETSKNTRALQRSESAGNRGVIAELAGSKAPGDESDLMEEYQMSATAFPGDAWMPDAFASEYGKWDD